PETPIIMLTAARTIKTAVEAMKAGAHDYLTKPFDLDELKLVIAKEMANRALREEVQQLRTEVSRLYGVENIVGKSQAMQEVFAKIRSLADTRTTILIQGETGVGKELVAKALHFNSAVRGRPFVAINCAAIPEGLLESELFGHERGAFTDAQSRRIGCFELANRGTLFLDEIGDLSPSCQAKILRALQEKKFMRLGGTETVASDVRLIAATNKDLEEEIRKGRFREDLYYRVNVIPIHLPPLRERKEDIPLLIKFFLEKKAREESAPPKKISKKALEALIQYDWPGNIREMENVIEQMWMLSSTETIGPEDIPLTLQKQGGTLHVQDRTLHVKEKRADIQEITFAEGVSLERAVEEFERKWILQALKKCDDVQTRAARLLGISRRILKYKMDALGISPPREIDKKGPA
ncbi:MAG TPA: sigma-54 dependent transcriptional regulator, partial [Candidatus Manganitrophaceae bacterium]